MRTGISAAILAVGIILLVWGIQATHSFASQVHEFFTGSPKEKAMWLLIGGVVATIVGLAGLVTKR